MNESEQSMERKEGGFYLVGRSNIDPAVGATSVKGEKHCIISQVLYTLVYTGDMVRTCHGDCV